MKRILLLMLATVAALAQPYVPPINYQPQISAIATNTFKVIDLLSYGVDVTGVTDSTAAFAAAFNTQQTVYGGNAIIMLPAGIVSISGSYTNTKPLYIEGAGAPYYRGASNTNSYWGSTIKYTGTTAPFLVVSGGAGHLWDFGIVGSYPTCTNANNIGIYVNGAFCWNFRNIMMSTLGYGWYIDGAAFNNTWSGQMWVLGAYNTQWYVNSAGTPNYVDSLYLQNFWRVGASDPTLTTLTGASISANTNITFTYTGSPPSWFTNNMNGYFSGVTVLPSTSAMGSAGGAFSAFIQNVTTTNFTISAPTTITNVSLSSATISESDNYVQTGPLAYFASGEWNISVFDDEQTILPSPAVSIGSAAKVHMAMVHTENTCFTNASGTVLYFDNYSDSFQIDAMELVNQGILAGQNAYILRNNLTGSTPNQAAQPANGRIGILWARDICTTTAATLNGTASGSGNSPAIQVYSSSGTIRANATPSFTSWGMKTPMMYNFADNPTGNYIGSPGEQTTYNVEFGLGTPYGGTSSNNTSIGYQANTALTSGVNLTVVGFQAGKKITSASQLTAIGSQAANQVTSGGTGATAVGYAAGQYAGSYLTAIGRAAGQNNAGTNNTAVGYSSFQQDNAGNNNTAIGAQALNASNSSTNNTAVGSTSFSAVTTGGGNTAVGASTGTTLTTGWYNTLVGANANVGGAAYSNSIAIGAGATTTASSQLVIGSSSYPITTATSATAGSASALPGVPSVYLQITVNGTAYKLPLWLP